MTTVDASPQIAEATTLALAGSFTIPTGPPVDDTGTKTAQAWQKRAWDVWHRLGEIRFPTSFIARQTTRIEWRVKKAGAKEPLSDEESRKLIDEVTEGIGQDEAARLICLNLQVAGEGYYVEDEDGDFHVYSVIEKGLDKKLKKARDAKRVALRFFYPDPTDTEAAESSIRTALDPAEELIALTDLSRAQSRSRLSQSGMFLYPAAQSWASGNPFDAGLQEAMMAPIKDPTHPAAMVPITIAMDGDLIEKVKHVTFERSYDEKIPGKIDTATKRIALAVDTDPELLLGMADANHWTAWNVTEERYNAYMGPLAARTAELFAAVIELKHTDMVGVEVIPDPSAILARRSTTRDALDAHEQKVVGGAFVREAIGATEEDAPTEEELAMFAAAETREPLVAETPGPPVAASMTVPDRYADRLMEGLVRGYLTSAIDQARSKVGAKLRTRLRSHEDLGRLDKVPNALCASVCHDHLSLIDVDATILEALAPFMAWWEGGGYVLSPREARLAVASHVKDTLGQTNANVTPALMESLGF